MLIHFGLLLNFRFHILKILNVGNFSVVHSVYIMNFNWFFYFPSILESEIIIDDGQFGIHNGVETLDSGWLTCQTEIRLRLHYSEKPPVSITKKKLKKSRFRYAHVYLLLRLLIFTNAVDFSPICF